MWYDPFLRAFYYENYILALLRGFNTISCICPLTQAGNFAMIKLCLQKFYVKGIKNDVSGREERRSDY